MPRKRIASAPSRGHRARRSIRKGDDATSNPCLYQLSRKGKAPRARPGRPRDVILPLAYRAPMSAIGRSVGIKSCPWLCSFVLFGCWLSESICSQVPGCLLPKAPKSIGEADTPASARPITSLAPHSNAGRDGSDSLSSVCVCHHASHVAKLLQR